MAVGVAFPAYFRNTLFIPSTSGDVSGCYSGLGSPVKGVKGIFDMLSYDCSLTLITVHIVPSCIMCTQRWRASGGLDGAYLSKHSLA